MTCAGTTIGLLFTALAAIVPARAAGTVAPPLLRTQAARLSGWVSTDLDGDRQADFARAGASRRDGHSYLQEITLRLSAFEDLTITVRTSSAGVRLSFRDLDGDADRDLVLETFNREPVAILLNDGEGRFHQGDVEDFRFQLAHRSHRSLESVEPEPPPSDNSECPNDESVATAFSEFWLNLAGARLIASGAAAPTVFQHFGASTRAPPSLR